VQKGAIVANEGPGDVTTYLPIPPAELLNGLKSEFDTRREEALSKLEGLVAPSSREQVYQLNTVAQVLERARSMIAGAREIVLFDLFPGAYEMLADDLEAARGRGVVVAGLVYDDAHKGPTSVPVRKEVLEQADGWPGWVLVLIVDGAEQLIAHISRDRRRLLNGVWSDSAFLSSVYHSALSSEIRLVSMGELDDDLKHISLMRFVPLGMRSFIAKEQPTKEPVEAGPASAKSPSRKTRAGKGAKVF